MFFKIYFNILAVIDTGVFLNFTHHLNDDIQRFSDGIGVETYFELIIWVLFGVFKDVIEDGGHHFADDAKGSIKIVFIPEQSQDNFSEVDVLVSINVLGIMIGNEGSTHFAYFKLKGVFDEGSSDEVIVLPLKTLVLSSNWVDGIIFIQFPVLNIITYRTTSPSLNLKDKRVTILINTLTI